MSILSNKAIQIPRSAMHSSLIHVFRTLILVTAFVLPMTGPSALGEETADVGDGTEHLDLLVETVGTIDDPSVLRSLLQGMLRGLEGRRNVKSPRGWSPLASRLDAHDDKRIRDLSMQLSQIFGDRAAAERALGIVSDTKAPPQSRRKMLQALLSQQNQEASMLLESLLEEPEMQLNAIRGYAIVENTDAPSILLDRYDKMSPEMRRAVIETLATRKPYASALLAAVEDKSVSRDDIPTHVARSLSGMLGDRFTSVFGPPPKLGADREKLIAKWKSRINAKTLAKANASRGRTVFQKTCAACHLLYGEGGKVGPDLTGSNRANLDYLLLNSIDPSYDVPDAYKTVTVLTVDGRAVNGVLAEENSARIVLKTAEQPRVVIAKEDIELRKISPKSMMPEGQLDQLKQQEVIDLIKYLRTTEQVEMSK